MFLQLRQAMIKAGERLVSTVGGKVSDAEQRLHSVMKVIELLVGRHFVPRFCLHVIYYRSEGLAR
jgi:hypothetical protein